MVFPYNVILTKVKSPSWNIKYLYPCSVFQFLSISLLNFEASIHKCTALHDIIGNQDYQPQGILLSLVAHKQNDITAPVV